ncbi:hypothetical protein [Streptomyces sp. NPDC086766]|uniref:allene oxide cyclase barrel-like domain-containing protein n=1 Tax=Streptomyces sp. NPDC086766 TaxID=3365754 RepID=UPI00381AA6E7
MRHLTIHEHRPQEPHDAPHQGSPSRHGRRAGHTSRLRPCRGRRDGHRFRPRHGRRQSHHTHRPSRGADALPGQPRRPPAQGDRTVFRSDLFDQYGNQVGDTGGTCVTTRVDNGGAEECVVNYNLPGGQLTVQGMVFGILNPGPPPSFDNAITGGTGVFDRARGSVHADTIGTGTRRFTIDLDR